MAVALFVLAILGVLVALAAWLRPRAPRASSAMPAVSRVQSKPPWQLTATKGSQYQLTRLGDSAAQGVSLDLGDYPKGLTRDAGPWPKIDLGASVKFLVIKVDQEPDPTITVVWRVNEKNDELRWSTALP